MKTFTTAAKRSDPEQVIEFELDDEKYHFTPPSTTGIWLASYGEGVDQVKAQLDWLGTGLEPDESEHLLARLKDPADDFDLDTAMGIVRWLTSELTGRPTGPSTD
jgi:hypothetical protein